MLSAVAVCVPLGFAAAVSPVMLAEQTVLVANPGGRRSGAFYALGTVLVLVGLVVLVTVLGVSVALPRAPRLDASLDLVLGGILLLLALVSARWRPGASRPGSSGRQVGDRGALGFGLLSMATNFTTLAIVLVAAKDVGSSGSPWLVQLLALVLLVVLASLPTWGPLAAAAMPGPAATDVLAAVNRFVEGHGRTVLTVLVALIGALLVIRGLVRVVAGHW